MSTVSRKIIKYIYIAYAAVQLCFLIGYYMIPGEGFLPKPDNIEDLKIKARTERQKLNENIQKIAGGDYEGIRLVKEWSFEYDGEKLEIAFPSGNYPDYEVILDQTGTDGGLIEVQQFATTSVISYVDVTEKVSMPLEIELMGNRLSITPPERQEVEIKWFEKEILLRQFSDSYVFEENNYYYAEIGANVIFVKVPEQVLVNIKGKVTKQLIK
jgi:hypothetical protein